MQGLAGAASRLLNEPLRPVQPLQSHGKFRLTLANDVGRARVHTDHSHWSGILYLSAPEHCQGGTEFFRHRRTNTDRLALNPAELAALGYADGAAMHRDIIERDSNDESAWEPTMTIPMRFNRLVLLRPWFRHGWACLRRLRGERASGLPDVLRTGRLRQRAPIYFTNAFDAPYSHCQGTPVSPSTNATNAGKVASARTSLPRITTQRWRCSRQTSVLPTASSWPPL